jgi:hypothetical protein
MLYVLYELYGHAISLCTSIFFLGTGRQNNCEAVQSDTPATLSMQQLLHCILTVRAIVKIIPGDQVFLNYGPAFWKETKSTAKGNKYLYTCAYISAHIYICKSKSSI